MTRIDLSQIAVCGRYIKSAIIRSSLGLAALGLAAITLTISAPAARSQGIPEDWADRHVVFSNPGSITDAVNSGSVEKWYKIMSSPRFQAQTRKRMGAARRAVRRDNSPSDFFEESRFFGGRLEKAAKDKPGKGGGGGTGADDGSLQKDWSMNLGAGGKISAGQFPAKFSFDATTAFCDSAATPDFVVFPTGLKGATTTQASIVAYDNIYSGCSGFTVGPLVYWSYNADAGTVVTSPVLSADGTQVAFIASGTTSSGTGATLVLLKWKAPATKGTNAATLALTKTVAASYRACAAPCLTEIPLSGTTPADSNSSPYYDYFADVLYVGDDTGTLHKFTNIFLSGTPVEITGGGTASGWPQTIPGGPGKLTSPVYDVSTGNLLVGTAAGTLVRIPGGSTNVGGGSSNIVSSGDLSAYATGITAAPIVDSQAGRVYVVTPCTTGKSCSNNGQANNAAIYQLTTSFTAAATGTRQTFGLVDTSPGVVLFAGSFDNIYFDSSNNTGSLYVCGISNTTRNRPSLYQVPITNNVMGTPVEGPELSTATPNCSPITEVLNGSTDLIFLSQQGANRTTAPINCPAGTGCIMSFNVTLGTALSTTTTTTAAKAGAASGTSGIIIDNVVGVPAGTSEVYFTPLANGTCNGNGSVGSGTTTGCAVQLSQAGLN